MRFSVKKKTRGKGEDEEEGGPMARRDSTRSNKLANEENKWDRERTQGGETSAAVVDSCVCEE